MASVWDYSCDAAGKKAQDWYPGDDVVDWWGVNIFSGSSAPDSSCVKAFVKAK